MTSDLRTPAVFDAAHPVNDRYNPPPNTRDFRHSGVMTCLSFTSACVMVAG